MEPSFPSTPKGDLRGSLSPDGWGQLSCCSILRGAGSANPGPVKGMAGSAQRGSNDLPTMITQTIDVITDPSYSRTQGSRHDLQRQLKPRCLHGPDSCTGHLDQYGPGSHLVLGHQHDLRWLTTPWISAEPLVVSRSMDIAQNHAAARHGPKHGPRQWPPKPDVPMAPGGNTAHPCQYGPHDPQTPT